ncbi:hypothetical protein BCR33DRAFT_716243 [Rhizoclosmatium globosum]|uniref:Uncharacterized protein n=1 Tax=Rhizoclosmatium globosum TaxID=329046 RepID=A0A1Y2CGY7_9FUNG|nr:hypothetical protein BCR33DRAFT_716243 [Rhizoclosmatium globosum]|eukprot:ORY45575.1 hypothetical protein BCR33DRAFT_716243 [Rhizoclosmatium globosum]
MLQEASPESAAFPPEDVAKIEMLGAQMVARSFFGGAPFIGSPTSSLYGMKDPESSQLTIFCLRDTETRPVTAIIDEFGKDSKRIDWWVGKSTPSQTQKWLVPQLLERGFEKQKASITLKATPPPHSFEIEEVTDRTKLGFSETFRSRGLRGDSSVPYGPGTSIRYFVIRSQDNSSVDATASISFLENGAYIHLVAGPDLGFITIPNLEGYVLKL